MTAADDHPEGAVEPGRDYRRLPPDLRLDDTIATVDPDPVPDPDAGRNVDQHRALRDD
ncbi:heme biosynthesis protein HemY [Nocardioides mesophilus]|uniref:Heme biosynthesis protein HemY n=1 Tax=Nocardioides mesophilus TaxID=433659 RepID=A0A7G9RDU5_9ACTN|nr:heme biosynthesis protein HemY [Nocardioides mesophilus]QNN53770.1 heme biosynthesis protein HemY [Nocardioides mesophilus]